MATHTLQWNQTSIHYQNLVNIIQYHCYWSLRKHWYERKNNKKEKKKKRIIRIIANY